VFGAVALLVAAFVIYNTFTILITQRIRQVALLRCIGAGRRQIFGATIAEAALVGLVGSALGVVCGIGVAAGPARAGRALTTAKPPAGRHRGQRPCDPAGPGHRVRRHRRLGAAAGPRRDPGPADRGTAGPSRS